jgi:hypothetical protein
MCCTPRPGNKHERLQNNATRLATVSSLKLPLQTEVTFCLHTTATSLYNMNKMSFLVQSNSSPDTHHAGLWYPRSRVRTRLKPSDFSGEKIHSTPSFGGDVKPYVPCRRFAASKRHPAIYVEVGIAGQIERPFLPKFRP